MVLPIPPCTRLVSLRGARTGDTNRWSRDQCKARARRPLRSPLLYVTNRCVVSFRPVGRRRVPAGGGADPDVSPVVFDPDAPSKTAGAHRLSYGSVSRRRYAGETHGPVPNATVPGAAPVSPRAGSWGRRLRCPCRDTGSNRINRS